MQRCFFFFFVTCGIFEGILLCLWLIESFSFEGPSDVSSWLELCILDGRCVSLKVSHLEAPSVHLSLIDDVNFDYPVKRLSDLYAVAFYYFPHICLIHPTQRC